MARVIKYIWFRFIMVATNWLPDFTSILKLRGFLLRPAFRKCGKNFQVASGTTINFSNMVEVGDNVFIANNCWIHGIGGIEIQNEVMLGPFTVLVTTNHTRFGNSWRFGKGKTSPIVLKRGIWTGAHVVITAGVTMGEGSAVAAGAVVTKDVLSDCIVGGIPAKIIKHLDD